MTEKEIRPSAESSEAEETLGGVAFDSTADEGRSVSYGSAQSSRTTIPSPVSYTHLTLPTTPYV